MENNIFYRNSCHGDRGEVWLINFMLYFLPLNIKYDVFWEFVEKSVRFKIINFSMEHIEWFVRTCSDFTDTNTDILLVPK